MAQYESDDKSGLAMDKVQVQAVDSGIYQGNFDTDDETILAQYDIPDDERRQLLRKLDSRIAPMVMILYLIAFLDRSEFAVISYVLAVSVLTFIPDSTRQHRERRCRRYDEGPQLPCQRSLCHRVHLLCQSVFAYWS